MGLKCSLLGHAFDPAGVERDREEQGSEVVTVVRELEECRRCGRERVVSENTEVAAVVDADEVDGDVAGTAERADVPDDADAGGFGGVVDRSGESDEAAGGSDGDATAGGAIDESAPEAAAAVDELADDPGEDIEARDPEEEDAEILTDDEPGREPGEWPEEPTDPEVGPDDESEPESPNEPADDTAETEAGADDGAVEDPEAESLSGITVPEGTIACEDCGFTVDAGSSYRDGDPCPECGSWLTADPGR